MGDRVELGPDAGGPAGAGVRDLAVDQLEQLFLQSDRRDRQAFGAARLDVAGDEVEQLGRVPPERLIGGEVAEVGIDPRVGGVIVAGAEVAVGAVAFLLAPHDQADLGVGLPVHEAVDDLHAGALELRRPVQVALLVEAGLELDNGGHRLARLCRIDQRGDHRRLVAGAVERLLDRDDRRIDRRLVEEVDHHLEALVGVLDHDVLLADGGEAVAVVRQDALGIARGEGRELEVRARLAADRAQVAQAEHAGGLGDHCRVDVELLAQQRLGRGVAVLVELEQHRASAPPPLDRGAEQADEILGFLLHLDVAVAQHAEQAVAEDAEAGEELVGVAHDQLLDRDVDRLLARHPYEARGAAGDQDHLDQIRLALAALQPEQHAHAEVGDEGEGV